MLNIPCVNPCPSCAPSVGGGVGPVDPDFPFVNLSSEAADVDNYIGRRYGGGFPPLGSTWYSIGCIGFCVSSVSQEDADQCAANQAVDCQSGQWPVDVPGPNPDFPFIPEARTVYHNSAQFCTFTCPDGSEFTYTTPAGYISAFSQAAADAQAYSFACNHVVLNYICIGPLTSGITCSGSFYSGTVTASAAKNPVTFSIPGPLPDGLMFSATTPTSAIIDGTPTTPGDYSFEVISADSVGNTASRIVNLVVFGIANSSPLTEATVDSAYSEFIVTDGTMADPVTFAVTSGALPDGLALNASTGEISGTPTVVDVFLFTVTATSGATSCSKQLSIEVAEPGMQDFLFTDLGGIGASFVSATINGNDYLSGIPNGTALGPDLDVEFVTLDVAAILFLMNFTGSYLIGAGEGGTYEFTMNNITIVPLTISASVFVISVNGLPVFTYNLSTTTGEVIENVPVNDGDTLSYQFYTDGLANVFPENFEFLMSSEKV